MRLSVPRLLPALAALTLAACGTAELVFTPAELAFGEVDFEQPLPDAGYNPTDVVVANEGTVDVILGAQLDRDRLRITGQLASDDPLSDPILPLLPAGSSLSLTFSVLTYDAPGGELGEEQAGEVLFYGDELAQTAPLPWSYTPIRGAEEE